LTHLISYFNCVIESSLTKLHNPMLSIALFRLAKHDPCTAPFDRNFLGLPPNGTNNSQADTGHTPAISSNLASLFHRCIPPRHCGGWSGILPLYTPVVQGCCTVPPVSKASELAVVYPGRLKVLYSLRPHPPTTETVVYPGHLGVLYSSSLKGHGCILRSFRYTTKNSTDIGCIPRLFNGAVQLRRQGYLHSFRCIPRSFKGAVQYAPRKCRSFLGLPPNGANNSQAETSYTPANKINYHS